MNKLNKLELAAHFAGKIDARRAAIDAYREKQISTGECVSRLMRTQLTRFEAESMMQSISLRLHLAK